MSNPRQYTLRIVENSPLGRCRAVDHYDWEAEITSSCDFGVSACAPSVFRDDDLNSESFHQCPIRSRVERPAVHDHLCFRQGQGVLGRVDQTQQVEMLRVRSELGQMHAPNGQHHARARSIQGLYGAWNIQDMPPVVTHDRRPRFARQNAMSNTHLDRRLSGIQAHLARKRMGGVNHMGDAFVSKVSRQPSHAAEPSDALRQRLAERAFDSSGKGHNTVEAGVGRLPREDGRFGRSGKDEEARVHV